MIGLQFQPESTILKGWWKPLFKRLSFFQKNLLLSGLFTLLIGFVLTASSFYFEGKVITDTLAEQGRGLTNLWSHQYDSETIKEALANRDPKSEVQKKLIESLDGLSANNSNVTQGYIIEKSVNENGKVVLVSNPSFLFEAGIEPGVEYDPSPEFYDALDKAMAAKAPVASEVYSDVLGSWFTVLTPMLDANGEVLAMFGIDMSANIISDSQWSMVKWLCIALMIVYIIFIVIQYINLKRMIRPIHELSKAVNEVGAGNLNIPELKVNSQDEVGIVVSGFNEMVKKLRNMMGELEIATTQLLATFKEVSKVSNSTTDQAEHVLRSLQEITASTEYLASEAERGNSQLWDINEKISEIRRHTGDASGSITDCVTESKHGIDIIEALKEKSIQTEQITFGVGQKIYTLEDRTRRINDLLSSIQDVAEQTGLLSLNASIEAARAGEHGRGFSVVADEIRKLSTNTKNASEEIAALLNDISRDVVSTGQQMRVAEESLREQSSHVENTIQSFYHIRDNIALVADSIHRVNETIHIVEQSKETLLSTVESVSSMSEETAASVEMIQQNFMEQVQSIHSLSETSQSMQESANRLARQLVRQDQEEDNK